MKVRSPGGHLDQMMRQTRAQHVQFSDMADAKAGMMLTVSSLVVTLSVPHLAKPHMFWPAATMIAACCMTIVFAAYATMPKLPPPDRSDLPPSANPRFNLMFFGHFAHVDYEEYAREMEKVFDDPGLAYEAMTRDVYQMGVYLATRKYPFVRLAYASFLSGIVVSSAIYCVAPFV